MAWILLVGLLVGFFPFVLRRLTRNTSSDFWLFYDSARYLWEHGVRAPKSKFLYYLPSVDVAFMPLAWLPLRWAAVAWFGLMTAGWLFLLAAVRRYLLWDYDGTQARRSVLCAALIVMPLFLDHLCVGAFHVLMVWLMVAGLGRIGRGKPWSGGMVLGVAVWIKLLPLVGVGYLLLKRKWLPAVLALATAVVVDLALSLAAYGPEATWQSHCEWWYLQAFGAQDQLLTDPSPLDHDRITNQSVVVVMRHLLTHMGHGTEADHYHAQHLIARGGERDRLQDPAGVGWLGKVRFAAAERVAGQPDARAIAGCLHGRHVVAGAGRGDVLSAAGPRASAAAMVDRDRLDRAVNAVVFPLVWSYHPTAALPALAVIFTRAPQRPRLAQAVAVLWLVSLALMGSPTARVMGVTLWTNLLLGVFLLCTARGEAPTLEAERELAAAAA